MTAFSGIKIKGKSDAETSLFAYPRGDEFLALESHATQGAVQPKIADTGDIVFMQEGDLHLYNFITKQGGAIVSGFDEIGSRPSIADSGFIVFAAEHSSLGKGILRCLAQW